MAIGFRMILILTLYFITILILITIILILITIAYTITITYIITIIIMTIIVIQILQISPILHIFTPITILLLQPNWPITIPSPLTLALTIRLTHILPIIKLTKSLHPIVNIRSFILFIILFVSTTYFIIFTISLIWYP